MKIVSYIFMHSGPLHTMMLQSCYTCYTALRLWFMYGTVGIVFAALAYVLCLLQ